MRVWQIDSKFTKWFHSWIITKSRFIFTRIINFKYPGGLTRTIRTQLINSKFFVNSYFSSSPCDWEKTKYITTKNSFFYRISRYPAGYNFNSISEFQYTRTDNAF